MHWNFRRSKIFYKISSYQYAFWYFQFKQSKTYAIVYIFNFSVLTAFIVCIMYMNWIKEKKKKLKLQKLFEQKQQLRDLIRGIKILWLNQFEWFIAQVYLDSIFVLSEFNVCFTTSPIYIWCRAYFVFLKTYVQNKCHLTRIKQIVQWFESFIKQSPHITTSNKWRDFCFALHKSEKKIVYLIIFFFIFLLFSTLDPSKMLTQMEICVRKILLCSLPSILSDLSIWFGEVNTMNMRCIRKLFLYYMHERKSCNAHGSHMKKIIFILIFIKLVARLQGRTASVSLLHVFIAALYCACELSLLWNSSKSLWFANF